MTIIVHLLVGISTLVFHTCMAVVHYESFMGFLETGKFQVRVRRKRNIVLFYVNRRLKFPNAGIMIVVGPYRRTWKRYFLEHI